MTWPKKAAVNRQTVLRNKAIIQDVTSSFIKPVKWVFQQLSPKKVPTRLSPRKKRHMEEVTEKVNHIPEVRRLHRFYCLFAHPHPCQTQHTNLASDASRQTESHEVLSIGTTLSFHAPSISINCCMSVIIGLSVPAFPVSPSSRSVFLVQKLKKHAFRCTACSIQLYIKYSQICS